MGPSMSRHSASVNARSLARTSESWPATRWRWIRSGGSARVAMTSRSCFGECEISAPSSFSTTGFSISCRSSRTRTTLRRGGSRPMIRCTGSSTASCPASEAPSTPSSASSTPCQKWGLQLSSRSTVNHATSRRPAAHDASKAVFPVPAWAEIRVSGCSTERVRSSSSRARLTKLGGRGGATSFVRWMRIDVPRRAAPPRPEVLTVCMIAALFSLSGQRDCHPRRVSARPLHLIDTRKVFTPTG